MFIDMDLNKNVLSSKNKVQEVLPKEVVRLTSKEYTALEQKVLQKANQYRGTEAGSLGVQVGVELVLRAIREGFSIG